MGTNYRNKSVRVVHGGAATVTNPNSTSSNQWFGTAAINSWWNPVSAPLVAATSRIALNMEFTGAGSVSAIGVYVCSKAAGTGFYINANSTAAIATASLTCHWKIENPA